MTRSVRSSVLLLATAAATWPSRTSQSAELASLLQPGLQLVYASDGAESPPWTIDSVLRNVSLGGRTGCVRLRVRTTPTQATADTRAHCTDSTTMHNWDDRTATLRAARPLGPRATLDIRQANGGRLRFETGEFAVERIRLEQSSTRQAVAPTAIEVLPTTVTTMDSTGSVVRRLRERFSIALATATGGEFEVPDSTQATGWRTVRRFALVAIRVP